MNFKSSLTSLFAPGQLKSLDGLRAIAILLVLVTHICQNIPGFSFVFWYTEWATPLYNGWMGVDLFFVLSGYLVGSVVIKGIKENRFSVSSFFLHRFFRILPAYFFVILVVMLVKPELPLRNAFINVALLTDYISANIGIPSWSLAIEEHFYIVLPFFLLFFRKFETRVFVAVALIFAALISRMFTYRFYSLGETVPLNVAMKFIYFPFHNRIDALAVGGLVALINSNFSSSINLKIYRFIISSLGLLLVGFVYLSGALKGGFFNTTIQFSLICLGFGGILWSVLAKESTEAIKIQRILSSKYWVPIARISYSVYLTHLSAIEITHHFFTLKIWMFPLVFGFCLLLALPLYLFIEYPCHQFARRRFSKPALPTTGIPQGLVASD